MEKFQIYGVKITANTFVSQKIESVHFYSCPQTKLSPGFYHYPPGRQDRFNLTNRFLTRKYNIIVAPPRGGESEKLKKWV